MQGFPQSITEAKAWKLRKSPSLNGFPRVAAIWVPGWWAYSTVTSGRVFPAPLAGGAGLGDPEQRVSVLHICEAALCRVAGKHGAGRWGSGWGCFLSTENKARQDIPRGQDALSYRLHGGKLPAGWESLCGTWISTELFAPWGPQPLRIYLGSPCVRLQWVQDKSVLSK